MINRLCITNFQSHKDSYFDFSEGINCIIGVSDSGKSSSIRALEAVLKKNPMYIRNNEQTSVIEILMNGQTIKRTRTESKVLKCPSCKASVKNLQICNSCGEVLFPKQTSDQYELNGEVYEKFGASLPDFITEKIRIYPVQMLDAFIDINIASQHDDFFFIGNTYSGNLRNKMISSLCKETDKVDNMLKDFRNISLNMKHKCDSLQDEITKIDSIENIIKDDFEAASLLMKEIDNLNSLKDKIENEISKCKILKNDIDTNCKYSLYKEKLSSLDEFFQKIEKMFSFLNDTEIKTLNKLRSLINENKKAKDIQFEDFKFDFEDLKSNFNSLSNLNLLKVSILKGDSVKGITFSDFEYPEFDENKKIQTDLQTLRHIKLQIKNDEIEKYKGLISNIESKIGTVRMNIEKELKDSFCPIIKDQFCEKCIGILKNA